VSGSSSSASDRSCCDWASTVGAMENCFVNKDDDEKDDEEETPPLFRRLGSTIVDDDDDDRPARGRCCCCCCWWWRSTLRGGGGGGGTRIIGSERADLHNKRRSMSSFSRKLVGRSI